MFFLLLISLGYSLNCTDCNENGICNINGKCNCFDFWEGSNCETFFCGECKSFQECRGPGKCVCIKDKCSEVK